MGNRESRQDQNSKKIDVHLFSEDLLSNHVDGIASFTDKNWSTESFSCRLLAKHGGNHYNSDHQAIRLDNKDCEAGNVFVGAGGMLPCDKVLFCVAAENELTEERDNFDHSEVTMVTNMLDKASSEEFYSLAILIGGSDASPHPSCLIPLLYCKFLMLSTSLQELHLISLDESLIDVMQTVLRESHEMYVKKAMLSTGQEQRNTSPHDEETSSATSVQKTQNVESASASNVTNVFQDEAKSAVTNKNHKPSETVDGRESENEDFENNIPVAGVQDLNIQEESGGPSVHEDDTVVGAVGGSDPPVFKQQLYDDDEEEEEEGFTFHKIMIKRGESNKSTGSVVEEQLDFENNFDVNKTERSTSQVNERSPEKGFVCSICCEEKGPLAQTKLDKCGHIFCKECIQKHLQVHGTCAVCKCRYSDPEGNQPDGIMSYFKTRESVAGYESCGTIVIEYDIPDGIQTERHPNPGVRYKGLHRSAFLPDNPDGNRILALLMKAFDKKLIFTVGTSITTGRENVTTWNDIHHKTNITGGPQRFGYPDPTYLRRVYDELMAKGITED
ncbi:uncharacterized protein [Argopecten irradians]|uniref:uncharacterized protein n=1 Tax=Argopecten irradians TaxID=31199 RepID=UPI003712DAD4